MGGGRRGRIREREGVNRLSCIFHMIIIMNEENHNYL